MRLFVRKKLWKYIHTWHSNSWIVKVQWILKSFLVANVVNDIIMR